MRTSIILTASLGIAIGALTSAQAQSWDGAYVALGASAQSFDFGDTSSLGSTTVTSHEDGAGVFAGAGYDVQRDRLVFGIMADVEAAGAGKLVTDGKDSYGLESDWFATARARAGYALSDDTLVYASGGVAWMQMSYDSNVFIFGGDSGTEGLFGTALGLGVEHRFANGLALMADYVHADFEDSGPLGSVGFEPRAEPEIRSLRIGLVGRF